MSEKICPEMQFVETRQQEGEAVAVRGLTLQCSDLRRPGQGSGLDWHLLTASSSSDSSGAWPPGRFPWANSRRWFPRGAPGRAVPTAPHTTRGSSLGRVSAAAPVLPPPGAAIITTQRHSQEEPRGPPYQHLRFPFGKPGSRGGKSWRRENPGGRLSPLSSEGTSGRA